MQIERRAFQEKKDDAEATGNKTQDYDIGLIISHDAPAPGSKIADVMSLKLDYWLILTNKYTPFPKAQLEKKLGLGTFKSSRTYPASMCSVA